MMNALYKYDNFYAPAGRIVVGAFFLMAGVSKLMGIAGTAGYISSVGLPMPTLLAWAAGLYLVAAGGALITGYQAKCAALTLAAYTLLVSFLFHAPGSWAADESGMQQLMFMKNLAIMGGLLFMTSNLKK